MPNYVSVAEARSLSGLRLVLSGGAPGPWGEAAKNFLALKELPYTPVAQDPGGTNDDLFDWVGVRNAPVLVSDDEPPLVHWSELLAFVDEQVDGSPGRLLPDLLEARTRVFGLSHLFCGRSGFGWLRRLILIDRVVQSRSDWRESADPIMRALGERYGYSPARAETAREGIAALLSHFASLLRSQNGNGSPYFVGDEMTAADVYSACFSVLLSPLPDELCSVPPGLRGLYEYSGDETLGKDIAVLLEHRDMMYERHLKTPLDF